MDNQILYLIRGLPGSGKSTLARIISQHEKALHFEADQYFQLKDQYAFDARKLRQAHSWCFNSTRNGLIGGYSVVVSNTFTTKKEILPYIELANDLAISYNIIICQGDFESIHDVPRETIEKMKNRFDFYIP